MSLLEIAKRARVSVATVSRTINRVPTVKPALARRVWKVIEEVGYYPNTNARALVSGHSRIFGLMVSEITNPFFPEIVQTFADLGVEHNYEVFLSSMAQEPRRLEVAARRMMERRVDGVAILTFGREDSLIEIFRRRNVPAVVVDFESPGPLLKSIRVDYKHGIRQAVQHLAAMGHVNIAFISGPAHLKTATARRVAFHECMEEIGLQISPTLLVDGDHTMEAGMRAMSALAALGDRPSAVVCSNDMTAIGVMRKAFELAVNIPRDLSVVGFDDIRLARFMTPPLTTVQMSQVEIATVAFRALLELVEVQSNRSSREAYEIRTNLVLRSSTGLAPGRLRESTADERVRTG
ncbi:MAG: LacI family DNA-binding transcriptional regulator [Candidatus Acidiferrum sp.]